MYSRHINLVCLFLFIISGFTMNGQISIVPLKYNHVVKNAVQEQTFERKLARLDTLPFVDDFALEGPFPNSDLWEENQVFVNTTFAKNPPSLGVATFDGLDSTGSPYRNSGQGDTLTSVGINLDITNINNLFLSYFVQEKGFGNQPESGDSLILEFKTDNGDWLEMKAYNGGGTQLDSFMFDAVEIASPDFHFDDFQFRFRNTSSGDGGGAVDLWHIDVVRVINNQMPSVTYRDLAFQFPSQGILKRYSSMPTNHFKIGTSGHLRDAFTFNIFNHLDVPRPIGSSGSLMSITELNSGIEISPPDQYLTNVADLNIDAATSKEIQVEMEVVDFQPTQFGAEDELEFEILFTIDPIPTDNDPGLLDNNFLRQNTIMSDYFAYDDGSAEVGIQAEGSGTQIAIEFQTSVADTLSAISMHFPHILGDVTDQLFNLKVWVDDLESEPVFVGSMLNTIYVDEFADTLQGFTTYRLQDSSTEILAPVELDANTTFYIGWEQVSNEFSTALPVGFDLTTTGVGQYHHFKTPDVEEWDSFEEIGLEGAILMRPVMGTENAIFTSTEQTAEIATKYTIYPNPTTGLINIEMARGQNLLRQIDVFDMQGRKVYSQAIQDQNVQLGLLPAGFYSIHLLDQNKNILQREKLIIQAN